MELEHMSVAELRKKVREARKVACPPVSRLKKQGLLGELAAYEAEAKARAGTTAHTMKAKAKKEKAPKARKADVITHVESSDDEGLDRPATLAEKMAHELKLAQFDEDYVTPDLDPVTGRESKESRLKLIKEGKEASEKAIKEIKERYAKLMAAEKGKTKAASVAGKAAAKAKEKTVKAAEKAKEKAEEAKKAVKKAEAKATSSSYREFMKEHMGKGKMTMAEAAAAWRAQKK